MPEPEESSADEFVSGSTMATVSKAVFYLYLACTVILREEIDAMSLICYSSTPPPVETETTSGGTENPFLPVFTTRLDLIITEAPYETTTPTATTTVPITTTTSETTSTLPKITTIPSITTTTPSFTTPTPSETTTPHPVSTTSSTTTTTLPVGTSTPPETTLTHSVTNQETTPIWTLPATTSPCADCPHIVSRKDWGAKAPTATTAIRHPIPKVFIHHTDTGACTTQAGCSSIVKGIQEYHQKTRGWDDIGYNFLVGEDGNAYEGRGWDAKGAHAGKWNAVSLGIAFIGNYTAKVPNAAAQNTARKLIACGVCMGKIAVNYTLHGHRDGCQTKCPGDALYNLISQWPHFGGNLGGKCKED